MNHTHFEGCSCHSHPPCSYCVDTFECDVCGDRHYSNDEDQHETEAGFLCSECWINSLKKLHLVLKGEWFDMIEKEIKTDEYRSLTKFWANRLTSNIMCDEIEGKLFNISVQHLKFKEFDVVEFQHGYSKTARRMIVEFKGFDLGTGKPKWGGSSEVVFIIKLGKVLNRNF